MTRTVKARPGEEVWETTTNGRVWLNITNERGRTKEASIGGRTGSRVRILPIDREINQDQATAAGHPDRDPFTNGMLRRVDANQDEDPTTASAQALSTEDLMGLFGKSGNAFQAAVDKLNEMNVRRMHAMAQAVDASASQMAYLEKTIREKYRVEGSTPTYDEMQRRGDTA